MRAGVLTNLYWSVIICSKYIKTLCMHIRRKVDCFMKIKKIAVQQDIRGRYGGRDEYNEKEKNEGISP